MVGAGPAGSACAIHLLERGHEVVILDQSEFPRDKPCGDGLTPAAVQALEQMGLERLVAAHQPIVGGRAVPRSGRAVVKRYPSRPGQAGAAACVPRTTLDEALLSEALQRGARLVRARVEAPIVCDGVVVGVRYRDGSCAEQLHVRHVVAADGATSRLRRALFGNEETAGGRAYAARAYFRTELRLDPLFEVHLPLEVDGRRVPGYAWVFPLDEHRANVGVGFFGGAGEKRMSIRRTFETVVAGLGETARFGDMEQEGRLFGSPLATRFSTARCHRDGITFVGDAANTVDPLSGEGIANALHGAELVATSVHDGLVRGRPGAGIATRLERRFPGLGQEPWRMLNIAPEVWSDDGLGEALQEPFLTTVLRVAALTEADPSLRPTAVRQIADQQGGAYVDALEQLDDALLAATATTSPLIAELTRREIRASGGPAGAATMLFTLLGLGGRLSREAIDFAAALALSEVLPSFVSQMSDRVVRTDVSSANDRLVVMATDFVVGRAAVLAAGCRAELLTGFARTAAGGCEGQMLQREDQGRHAARHAERVAATTGGLFALAAWSGAVLASTDAETRRRMESFGNALGCAKQLAAELIALTVGDPDAGRRPGTAARRGLFCLSMLDTARRAGRRSDTATLARKAAADPQALGVAVRAAEQHGAQAKSFLDACVLANPAPMSALVDATLEEMRHAAACPSPKANGVSRRVLPPGSGVARSPAT